MGTILAGTTRLIARYPFDGDDPTVWPVTLPALKAHAQVRHDLEDASLEQYIADATEYVEARGQVSLIHQRRRQVLDSWPCGQAVQINRGPLVSVQSITRLDAAGDPQDVANGWRADTMSSPGGIFFQSGSAPELADGPGVLWIDYTAGYGTAPSDVPAQWRQLILAVATHCYERRELATGGGFDDAFEMVLCRRFAAAGRNLRYA